MLNILGILFRQNGTFWPKMDYGLDKIKDFLGIYIFFEKNRFYE